MIGDRDLLEFRLGYYRLLSGLLGREPTPALLEAVARDLPHRVEAARALRPALGEGWARIGAFLEGRAPGEAAEAAADEFTRLFVGPRRPPVNPYESYYLTGGLFDRPLALVRAFLRQIGIEKEPGYAEPEDSLAFELGVMARLLERQRSASDPDTEADSVNLQAAFLKRHLLVWGPRCAEDLERAEGADFYRGVGALLRGFLELELALVREWGPEPVRTLEEARAAVGSGAWRGPLFDPTPSRDPDPPPGSPGPGGQPDLGDQLPP